MNANPLSPLALAALLAGCASTPVERVHTLLAAPSAAVRAAAAPTPAAQRLYTLAPVRVPPGVDGVQWLVRLADGTLARLEQDRWSAPLRDELRAAIADRLATAHRAVDARTAVPGTPSGPRLDVELRRFDTVPGEGTAIAGSWTLSLPPGGPGIRCDFDYRESAPGPSGALADAHRRAVERLADAIGAALAAPTPSCGAG